MLDREPRLQADGSYLLTLTKGAEARLCATGARFAAGQKWCVTGSGYAVRRERTGRESRVVYLHVELARYCGMDMSGSIDHVNRDRLDCRLENLRSALHSQNICNQGLRADNTSGYRGVCFHKQCGKWLASIGHRGRQYSLGLFATPEEASAAYKKAAAELHGMFNPLVKNTDV